MMENTWYRGKLCSKLPRNYNRNSVCYFCILTRFFSIPFIVASASRGTSMRLAFDYMSVPLWFRPIRQAHQAESAAYQLDPNRPVNQAVVPGQGEWGKLTASWWKECFVLSWSFFGHHYSDVTWMSWCLKSPIYMPFVQQRMLPTKLIILAPWGEGGGGGGGIPFTKGL